jgi:hypothetical protein
MEEGAGAVYEHLMDTGLASTIGPLLRGSQKRLSRLKWTRQELVTEMILEPITGVDGDIYVPPPSTGSTEADLLKQAVRMEENMHRFYSDTASIIPMKQVERAFLRLAKENQTRIAKLESLLADL